MMLAPVMLAGCLLLLRARPRLGWGAIYATVSLQNLIVLPFLVPLITRPMLPDATPGTASHVLWYFKVPIHHLADELKRLENPPDYVDARVHLAEGNRRYDKVRIESRRCIFSTTR